MIRIQEYVSHLFWNINTIYWHTYVENITLARNEATDTDSEPSTFEYGKQRADTANVWKMTIHSESLRRTQLLLRVDQELYEE